MTSRRHLVLGSALLPWIAALPARAQAAPTRLLLGFPPGGTVDQISRHLSARLGEGVRVEARVGGGGRHAVEELMKAPADGSTLLLTPMSMVTLYPHLYPQLGYGAADPVPVAALASLGFALGVGPAVPASVRTLADLVGWVRAGGSSLPGYGTPGPGTPPHFIGALFERGAQCTLPHVAYRGAAPAMRDLLGGQLAVYIGPEGDSCRIWPPAGARCGCWRWPASGARASCPTCRPSPSRGTARPGWTGASSMRCSCRARPGRSWRSRSPPAPARCWPSPPPPRCWRAWACRRPLAGRPSWARWCGSTTPPGGRSSAASASRRRAERGAGCAQPPPHGRQLAVHRGASRAGAEAASVPFIMITTAPLLKLIEDTGEGVLVLVDSLDETEFARSRLTRSEVDRLLRLMGGWRAKSPDLFKKRPKNLPGLDS